MSGLAHVSSQRTSRSQTVGFWHRLGKPDYPAILPHSEPYHWIIDTSHSQGSGAGDSPQPRYPLQKERAIQYRKRVRCASGEGCQSEALGGAWNPVRRWRSLPPAAVRQYPCSLLKAGFPSSLETLQLRLCLNYSHSSLSSVA